MWQFLVAAALAGSSGFFAGRCFSNANGDSTPDPASQQTRPRARRVKSPVPRDSNPPHAVGSSNLRSDDSIFRFSSQTRVSAAPGGKKSRRGNGNGKKGVDVQRFSVCLKKRKTGKSASKKCGSCCSTSKDGSLINWGLSAGIVYMLSAGKTEISKLSTAVDETARVIEEMKTELFKRKSACSMQISSSVTDGDAANVKETRGRHHQTKHNKSTTDRRSPDGMKDSGLFLSDDSDSASSVLTEEPQPEILEIDQLEAELECELQKLPGCFMEDDGLVGMKSSSSDKRDVGPEAESSESYHSNGVSPYELDQKLSRLLIGQQESHIVELESELHMSQSKLWEKEAELRALKDCVKRLTEFSLSSVADDEMEACVDEEKSSNQRGPSFNKSLAGTKRTIDF